MNRLLSRQTLDVGRAVWKDAEVVLLPAAERNVPIVLVEVEFDPEFIFCPEGDGYDLVLRGTLQKNRIGISVDYRDSEFPTFLYGFRDRVPSESRCRLRNREAVERESLETCHPITRIKNHF